MRFVHIVMRSMNEYTICPDLFCLTYLLVKTKVIYFVILPLVMKP